jgi:hypothetical protein
MVNYYTGIGSRQTPLHILDLMKKFAVYLAKNDFVLRSGGADGADNAFEQGCNSVCGKKEIYLPWQGFNNNSSTLYGMTDGAKDIARRFHPNWYNLSVAAEELHTRNVYQILGCDLKTPSSFVICWTKDGLASGGTGQALRIAKHHSVPILNLYNLQKYDQCVKFFSDKRM